MAEEARPLVRRLGLRARARGAHGRFAGHEVTLALGGVGLAAARRAASELVAGGCDRLLSVGLAGGLHPDLAVGEVVALDAVVADGGQRWSVAWPARGDRRGVCLTRAQPTGSATEKAHWRAASGADVVDMETAAVAAVATEHARPWAGLRAVSDAAHESLPPAIVACIRPDLGRVLVGRLLVGAVVRPWLWPHLVRLGLRSAAAGQALASAVVATLESLA